MITLSQAAYFFPSPCCRQRGFFCRYLLGSETVGGITPRLTAPAEGMSARSNYRNAAHSVPRSQWALSRHASVVAFPRCCACGRTRRNSWQQRWGCAVRHWHCLGNSVSAESSTINGLPAPMGSCPHGHRSPLFTTGVGVNCGEGSGTLWHQ